MKRNIIKLGLVVFATLLFISCNDDFLERFPLDEISNETYWNTENDLMVYNNSLYNLTRNDHNVPILMGYSSGTAGYKYNRLLIDEFTDNITAGHSRHIRYQQVRAGKHNISADAQYQGWTDGGWVFVRRINVFMDNYAKALENGVAAVTVNKYVGEARLFRGWFYAEKITKFGAAPWVDHELNIDSEELNAPLNSREEVMTNVLADLNFACENLPADWGDGRSPGRLNKWAALLIKSRICLFEGTWRKYHNVGSDANMWLQQAADATKEILEGDHPYALYSTGDPDNDYQHIFKIESDLTGVNEVMYWKRYQLGIYTHYALAYHRAYNGGATKSMVEDYLCTDGKPITTSSLYMGDETFENVFENRDPRLRQTILHPDDVTRWSWNKNDISRTYPRLAGMGGLTCKTGYHVCKNYTVSACHSAYNAAEYPAISLRFAEVLLNYAEAMAELGTLDQAGLDISINLLRDRVGMPHLKMDVEMDPKYADDGVSALISEIRRERRVELFMEGFRYDDLRRWKQGKKLLSPDLGIRWDAANKTAIDPDGKATVKSSSVNGIDYVDVYKGTDFAVPEFDESKHYLWPIPLNAIAQNPQIEQTPGWN